MKAQDLTVVWCELQGDTEVDLLLEILDGDAFTPTFREDIETGRTVLEVFLEDPASIPDVSRQIKQALAIIGSQAELSQDSLPAADWSESWKRFFHVMHITDRVVIRPSWETYDAKPDECVITLDPGMSFGTGQHPTTMACLQLLDSLAQGNMRRPVLDMGCGSGILSIAAKKLGFTNVRGFDYDSDAVVIAQENAAINDEVIPYEQRDLADNLEGGSVVLANILGPVLIQFASEIACAVLPGGDLIISGILDTLYPEVKVAFEAKGLTETQSVIIGEWRSGLMHKSEEC